MYGDKALGYGRLGPSSSWARWKVRKKNNDNNRKNEGNEGGPREFKLDYVEKMGWDEKRWEEKRTDEMGREGKGKGRKL